jgi:hypothetical protein
LLPRAGYVGHRPRPWGASTRAVKIGGVLPKYGGSRRALSVACGVMTNIATIAIVEDAATLDVIRRAAPIPHLRKPFNDEPLFAAMSQVVP